MGEQYLVNVSYLLLILATFNLPVMAAPVQLECYSCNSNMDSSCMSSPSTTTTCEITHGKGCATRVSPTGIIERGCSDIGISPEGCRVSQLFGSECVCHSDRCNSGIPSSSSLMIADSDRYISCYTCNSTTDAACTHDVTRKQTSQKTCRANNGCFFTKRIDADDGTVIYNRLCYEYDSPATYYPAGCYTVFNGQKSPTIEVCVCYTDECNKNMKTALDSSAIKEPVKSDAYSISYTNPYSILTVGLSYILWLS